MDEMLKDIDQDGDGEVDYREFSSLMTVTSSYKNF
jgi:Ca2+-binding EF-hand superfamily protein